MKKICSILLAVALLCGMLCVPVSADAPIRVVVGGERVEFDVQPMIVNGRTLVPLRAIFEALEASVAWDDASKTVTAKMKNTNIRLAIGDGVMYVNDRAAALDTPAVVVDGRTLVPVRAISEAFGLPVYWNEATQTVQIKVKVSVPVAVVDSDGFWSKYTYDANGNETYRETSSGFWKKSTYDANGNQTYSEDSDGFKSTYDANGNRTYYERADGYWEKYTYDANGNETYWENSNGFRKKYTYDANGNETYWENSDGEWGKHTYDANGNRTYSEYSNGKLEKYTYDANGNRTYWKDSNGSWYKYTYSYDENGNKISEEYIYFSGYTSTTLYTYNSEGYLTQKVEEDKRAGEAKPTYTTTTYIVIEK